jgi:hypothetical protein
VVRRSGLGVGVSGTNTRTFSSRAGEEPARFAPTARPVLTRGRALPVLVARSRCWPSGTLRAWVLRPSNLVDARGSSVRERVVDAALRRGLTTVPLRGSNLRAWPRGDAALAGSNLRASGRGSAAVRGVNLRRSPRGSLPLRASARGRATLLRTAFFGSSAASDARLAARLRSPTRSSRIGAPGLRSPLLRGSRWRGSGFLSSLPRLPARPRRSSPLRLSALRTLGPSSVPTRESARPPRLRPSSLSPSCRVRPPRAETLRGSGSDARCPLAAPLVARGP